jgi:tetratricopeptide (TPR) repeat protein
MFYICLFLLLFSCSSHYTRDATAQLREGRFEEAEKNLSKADRHYTTSNNSVLFLLSRAMVYFQSGQFGKSTQDFNKAFDAIDYYKQKSVPEIASQTLIQDDLGAYVPPHFEESLARFYQALAFLHTGQEDNAAATLHYLENHVKQDDQNPLTTYLLAALFERRGDSSNARVLCNRLHVDTPKGNVLIIHHRGTAPHLKSETSSVSIVSAALLEEILHVSDVKPALSTLVGIPVPVLAHSTTPNAALKIQNQLASPKSSLNNKIPDWASAKAPAIELSEKGVVLPQYYPFSNNLNPGALAPPNRGFYCLTSPKLTFDIARAAEAHLDKEMPWTAARAAARILIRRGAVASTKEKFQPIVDVAMFISNITTKADTRSWAMLPSCIDLYHLDLEPGKHNIQAGRQNLSMIVKPHDLTIVEIFQPTSENIFITKETL